jgi:hypothetical protein
LTADPTPARDGGSTSRIDSVAGVEMNPMPSPIITICGTITAVYDVSTSTLAIQRNALPNSTSPVVTTARVPIRGASIAPITEATAMDSATGRMRAPVDRVPQPRMNCMYWVIRKMKPNSAKKVTVTAPLAALKRASLNRVTSSIGCELRRSTTTNVTSRIALTANPVSVAVDCQPWSGASMIV